MQRETLPAGLIPFELSAWTLLGCERRILRVVVGRENYDKCYLIFREAVIAQAISMPFFLFNPETSKYSNEPGVEISILDLNNSKTTIQFDVNGKEVYHSGKRYVDMDGNTLQFRLYIET